MSFQTTVRSDQASFIIGEILYDGPVRARNMIVDSNGATPNTVGFAYTRIAGRDDACAAGSAGGGAFAGILVNPKAYASEGGSAGALSPTLDIADNVEGELMTMGTIPVNLSIVGTGAIGEGVFYVDATGALGSGVAGGGQTQIANAKIDYKTVAGVGPAIITLTEAE